VAHFPILLLLFLIIAIEASSIVIDRRKGLLELLHGGICLDAEQVAIARRLVGVEFQLKPGWLAVSVVIIKALR